MALADPTPMRCLVALPDRAGDPAAPPALLAGLIRRNAQVRVARGAPWVMLELASEPIDALVVVDPEHLAGLDDLVAAVAGYFPSIVCWRFDESGGGEGRLSELTADPGAARQRVAPLLVQVDEPAGPPSPLVTHEELSMLLGQEDPEAENTGMAGGSPEV